MRHAPNRKVVGGVMTPPYEAPNNNLSLSNVFYYLRRNRGRQRQTVTIPPQMNQESTQRPKSIPKAKQSRQQLCKSLLRHIAIPLLTKKLPRNSQQLLLDISYYAA